MEKVLELFFLISYSYFSLIELVEICILSRTAIKNTSSLVERK